MSASHPFELVNLAIASTMDREGLIDWLQWKKSEINWKDISPIDLTRDDALKLVERILKEKI